MSNVRPQEELVVRGFTFAILALLSACTSESAGRETELFVTPESFIVDGEAYSTADAAATAVQQKAPASLSIASCSAMQTKRVTDAMASLQGKHGAHVRMSSVQPGQRGCPEFK